jgi:hypothetical protein
MSRMVRKQVYITPEQNKVLKERARILGVTESDLLRWAIDRIRSDWQSHPVSEAVWQESLAFMGERAKLAIPGEPQPRTWTREDLYDERPKRFAR